MITLGMAHDGARYFGGGIDMEHRVIEICYDLDAIPGRNPDNPVDPRVLKFRDRAMARIDEVLDCDGLGRGIGADVEFDRLRLRFVVMDFDAAEIRLDKELCGTAWDRPVEVLRYWDAKLAA